MIIFLLFILPELILGSVTLRRRPRSIAVGSVLIENETDDLLRIHVESNLVISAFKATEVVGKNRTSSRGIGFTQDGFTTIKPRDHKLVKFTIPAINGNSLVQCSVFTNEMVNVVHSETLENNNSYKLEKFGDVFLLEPLGIVN